MAKKKAGPRLPAFSRGASSANPDRVPGRKANKSGGSLRDKATIKRLKLYTGGKIKRDKQGVVVEGDLARRVVREPRPRPRAQSQQIRRLAPGQGDDQAPEAVHGR